MCCGEGILLRSCLWLAGYIPDVSDGVYLSSTLCIILSVCITNYYLLILLPTWPELETDQCMKYVIHSFVLGRVISIRTLTQVEIIVYWPTHCAVTPLVYSRNQGHPSRRCLHLERFAGGCDLRSVTAGVQTMPEDSSVQPQLSEHMCYLNFVFLFWQWS